MLADAAKFTGVLGPSIPAIAEAIVDQGPDEFRDERTRIEESRSLLARLLNEIDHQASPSLRRVK